MIVKKLNKNLNICYKIMNLKIFNICYQILELIKISVQLRENVKKIAIKKAVDGWVAEWR